MVKALDPRMRGDDEPTCAGMTGLRDVRTTVLLVCRNDGVPYQASPAASRANHCAMRARDAAGSAAAWLNSLVFGEYA